jgi:hypothetical protein
MRGGERSLLPTAIPIRVSVKASSSAGRGTGAGVTLYGIRIFVRIRSPPLIGLAMVSPGSKALTCDSRIEALNLSLDLLS